MENPAGEPTVQSSYIDEEEITQPRELLEILFENDVVKIYESMNETGNVSVKSVKETKLPLDIDDDENVLFLSREFNLTQNLK